MRNSATVDKGYYTCSRYRQCHRCSCWFLVAVHVMDDYNHTDMPVGNEHGHIIIGVSWNRVTCSSKQ